MPSMRDVWREVDKRLDELRGGLPSEHRSKRNPHDFQLRRGGRDSAWICSRCGDEEHFFNVSILPVHGCTVLPIPCGPPTSDSSALPRPAQAPEPDGDALPRVT